MTCHAKVFGGHRVPDFPEEYNNCQHNVKTACYYCFLFPDQDHPDREIMFCIKCLNFMKIAPYLGIGKALGYTKCISFSLNDPPPSSFVRNNLNSVKKLIKHRYRSPVTIYPWSVCLQNDDGTLLNQLRPEFFVFSRKY
ncbi:MAG: hypothetical protein Dasosvirus1_2 [Dasosvirus sp.]|uniref:Uncharacterized protein n=1 Tax=Dasosvirus sp. TaxID=2487764 RepID=A0A3G4ZR44_9VIRU|nr:MAG: hypothetical protein Dasosvirus1_2 [Dasosvirus sp.]